MKNEQPGGIEIPTNEGPKNIEVRPRIPVFILGRNGSGKSALINHIARHIKGKNIFLPGNRPSHFDREGLSLSPDGRRQLDSHLEYNNSEPTARWQNNLGTQRNEKAVYDILAAENQYNADYRECHENKGEVVGFEKKESPLKKVNHLLRQANMTVKIKIDGGELRVEQNDSIYSYARMSDGERSALVLAAEVATAESGTVFLLDEPELHLHLSIVAPLIRALILARSDCGFVVCTHQLEIPNHFQDKEVLLVQGCRWKNEEISTWDIDIIDKNSSIPEWLLTDILGAREKILFVEGDDKNSLDQPFYSLMFPDISVRPLGSCKKVIEATKGLRETKYSHRIEAFGLIDGDGRSEEDVTNLESDGVYPLTVFYVESFIYSQEAQNAVAEKQSKLLGRKVSDLTGKATDDALKLLEQEDKFNRLASLRTERKIRDKITSIIPKNKDIREGLKFFPEEKIDVGSQYDADVAELRKFIKNCDLVEIIKNYPVRESGILSAIAKGLEFPNRRNYEEAVFQCISEDATLKNALQNKIGKIVSQLNKRA